MSTRINLLFKSLISLFFLILLIFFTTSNVRAIATSSCCFTPDCPADNQVCKNAPADCPGSGTGGCVITTVGGTCTYDADCGVGGTCEAGKCKFYSGTCGSAKAPGCDGLCAAGSTCTATADGRSCVCKGYVDRCNGSRTLECKKSCSPAGARDGECWKQHNTVQGTWCWTYNCKGGAMTLASPSLVSPANGATVSTDKVRLTWNVPTNWGKSCNPDQVNSYQVYAGLNSTGNLVYSGTDANTPKNALGQPHFLYDIPSYYAPGSKVYWHVKYSNNCQTFNTSSPTWNFITQGGITGNVYYDPTNTCSTAQKWNLSTALRVRTNTGLTANVVNGSYSLATSPANYNLTLSGMSAGYICSTGCAQACPTTTNTASPGTASFFLTFLPGPWWQVKDGDVESGGDLSSQPPAGTFFDVIGPGGFPGIPSYSGTLSGIDSNNVSEKKWLAESAILNEKIYNYQFFINQVPTDILSTFNIISPGDDVANDLTKLDAQHDNNSNFYYWYKYDGKANGNLALTIPTVDIGDRKVVVFVDSADVNISGNITLNDGVGFFLLIVGSDTEGNGGTINVETGVGGGGVNLEGLYVADNGFIDGTLKPDSADIGIHVRGSVVAYKAMSLQRDLGADNNTTPGELFEYAPDQLMLFPKALSVRKINWKEIAP